ncbi:MAG: hypothetical protein KDC28_06680 [Saprospiraceae bacterium]|nr:hypothetical protein [Saprospiraceae bacterium]MCB9321105.1 hypothetical protein [Lewinellaceae bacterium]
MMQVRCGQKRLYFTSERSAIPTHFDKPENLTDILREFRQPAHGTGRIYCIDLEQVLRLN